MADETLKMLGKLAPEGAQRDAVHIAVVPVVAATELAPGDFVGVLEDGRASGAAPRVGIVDPFLDDFVRAGDRFWLYLLPGSITSLRHHWTHPSFKEGPGGLEEGSVGDTVAAAKAVIEQIAREMGGDGASSGDEEQYYGPWRPMTYERLMAAAEEWLAYEDYHVQMGSESWRADFPAARFWAAYEVVTGKRIPHQRATNFFSCSC